MELPYITEEDIELKRKKVSKTEHDLESVDRYIKDYERIKFLVRRGINKIQIQNLTGRGSSVAIQYIDIIGKYHSDIINNNTEK